jgi:hypothetical protein
VAVPTKEEIQRGFQSARRMRQPRENRFDQAMRFAMPGRGSFFNPEGDKEIDDVFDETAIVATQEFASRLQAGMTPNFSRWAMLVAGSDVPEDAREQVNKDLQQVTEFVFQMLDQSNFATESYEAYLDLAVTLGCFEIDGGTATSPLMFTAVPIAELYVLNGPFDRIDSFYRLRTYTHEQFTVKYPDHKISGPDLKKFKESERPWNFLECIGRDWSKPNDEMHHRVILCHECNSDIVLVRTYKGVGSCPMIAFRWSKESGSVWGRGPLMNALPAIKTCNMVVQMVLENAQMAIAGLYNMDDDATINVDTVELVPGTIIPRTPGTKGLEAVQPAGDFRVSDLILSDMRLNIKRALYNDMLGNPNRTPMSATEVAERMADLARQIGAAFGRLMFEMVVPTLQRVVYILKERGLIAVPTVNGREIKIVATSPLSQAQNQMDIQNVDRLVEWVAARFGPQLANIFIKGEEASAYVADKLMVPDKLLRGKDEMNQMIQQISQMQQQAAPAPAEASMTGAQPVA